MKGFLNIISTFTGAGGGGGVPYKSDSLRDFREIVHKADGYYLKDYSSASLDGKLCKCIEAVLPSTGNKVIQMSNAPFDEGLACPDNTVCVYEFHAAISDLTISTTVPTSYDNGLLMNSSYPYVKGFILTMNQNHLKLFISSSNTAPGKQIITSTFVVPDNNYHYFKMTIDTTTGARKVIFQMDSTIESHDITVDGSSIYGNNGVGCIGGYSQSASFRIAYLKVSRNGTVTLNIPMVSASSKLWDIVSGTITLSNGNTWTYNNDGYPTTNFYDLDLCLANGVTQPWTYLPRKANGDAISYPSFGNIYGTSYKNANYYNYECTQVQPNPTNESLMSTAGYNSSYYWTPTNLFQSIDGKNFLYAPSGSGLQRWLVYGTNKTTSQKNKINSYLGNTLVKAMLEFGDSIAAGAGAANANLPSYLTGQITNARILQFTGAWNWDPILKVYYLATLSKDTDIPPYMTQFNGPELCYGYLYGQPLLVIKYGSGGATCGPRTPSDPSNAWDSASGGLRDHYINQVIPRSLELIRKDGKAISEFEMFVCLGTNDSSYPTTLRDAFETNFINLINAVRAVVGTDTYVNLLRIRMSNSDAIIVGNLTNDLINNLTQVRIYSSENLDYYDGVHPNCLGNIEIATMWYNRSYVLGN